MIKICNSLFFILLVASCKDKQKDSSPLSAENVPPQIPYGLDTKRVFIGENLPWDLGQFLHQTCFFDQNKVAVVLTKDKETEGQEDQISIYFIIQDEYVKDFSFDVHLLKSTAYQKKIEQMRCVYKQFDLDLRKRLLQGVFECKEEDQSFKINIDCSASKKPS